MIFSQQNTVVLSRTISASVVAAKRALKGLRPALNAGIYEHVTDNRGTVYTDLGRIPPNWLSNDNAELSCGPRYRNANVAAKLYLVSIYDLPSRSKRYILCAISRYNRILAFTFGKYTVLFTFCKIIDLRRYSCTRGPLTLAAAKIIILKINLKFNYTFISSWIVGYKNKIL